MPRRAVGRQSHDGRAEHLLTIGFVTGWIDGIERCLQRSAQGLVPCCALDVRRIQRQRLGILLRVDATQLEVEIQLSRWFLAWQAERDHRNQREKGRKRNATHPMRPSDQSSGHPHDDCLLRHRSV